MASGRVLQTCICDSERMWDLSCEEARLLYTWLIAWLDINGVFYGSAKRIKSKVWSIPEDEAHSVEAIEKYLEEMRTLGLIIRYDENGKQYIWFPDFVSKQLFSFSPKENPVFPVNEHIIKHNLEAWELKRRHKSKEEHPETIPQQVKKPVKPKKPESDLVQIHSYLETVHYKKTGEKYTPLTDEQKGNLNDLINKYDGKVMKCIDELYSGGYKDELLVPKTLIEHFDVLLKVVNEKVEK